jgi:hypothetical protein
VLVAAQAGGVPQGWGLLLAIARAPGLRVAALVFDYSLPRWSAGSDAA